MLIPPELLEYLRSITEWIDPFLKSLVLPFLKVWWWAPLPFLLTPPFLFLWLQWRRESWLGKQKSTLLEIRIPKEIEKPVKAMEQVFASFWTLYGSPPPRDKWIEGKLPHSMSLEIVGLGGETHFYIRVPTPFKDKIESDVYSQYPEVEISEVEDYTKLVPQDIPNKDWDLWGCDYVLAREDSYPLKTYRDFETGTEAKEQKRVDPMAVLLEGLAKLKKGEQLWVQMVILPITTMEDDWVGKGEKIRDELVRRPSKPPPKPMIEEAADVLIKGKVPGGPVSKKEEALIPPEMKLTPGERGVVESVERKISKYGFKTHIRFIYLGKRDVFFKPNVKLPMGFFNSFNTLNLNTMLPWRKTLTSQKTILTWFSDKRVEYLKKRRMFRNYIKRSSPLFPRAGGVFILNTEELATLYHFPSGVVASAPSVPRIEAKKAEAPPGLPVE